jgi:murein DD-endopeptidase MepM/ murein hydrolase activator NlpD
VALADAPRPSGAIGQDRRLPLALVERTPPPPAPEVVRFRPSHGVAGVPRSADVSVRFTQPMEHASTEGAFRAFVDGTPVSGTFRWAEGDTVLVLSPASRLPYGAAVTLQVEASARTQAGRELGAATSIRFTVQPKPTPPPTPKPTVKPDVPPARPAAAASAWQWPLNGPITQLFGQKLTKYGYHQGLDINGETGDPIRAARAGTVVVAGRYDDCSGLQVTIDHGGGLQTWYRHMSRIDVKVGARVAAGTVIGAVGNTGCSLGSHLHFAVREGRTFVDPLRYLPPR